MLPSAVPVLAVAVSPVLAADAAFYAVFGVFVVALVVLAVITLRWAIRRDRAGRAQWLQRREADRGIEAPGPSTNGRASGRRGQPGGESHQPR